MCSNLRANRTRKVLVSKTSVFPQQDFNREHHFTFRTPSPYCPTRLLLSQFPYFCAAESPILGIRSGLPPHFPLPPYCFPDARFPWESRLLGTAAAASLACSCCSETGQHGSAVFSLRTDFFFFIYP